MIEQRSHLPSQCAAQHHITQLTSTALCPPSIPLHDLRQPKVSSESSSLTQIKVSEIYM